MFIAKWVMSITEYICMTKGTPEGEHDLVWSLYNDHNGNRHWQYKVETSDNGVVLLIESSIKFEKEPVCGTFVFKEIKIPESEWYKVKVTLNPIIQLKEIGKKNPKRIPLIKPDHIKSFVENIFLLNGLEIKSFNASKPVGTISMKGINFVKSEIVGVVKVLNKQKVFSAIEKGIGKERSYGCGMLCLTPINEPDFED